MDSLDSASGRRKQLGYNFTRKREMDAMAAFIVSMAASVVSAVLVTGLVVVQAVVLSLLWKWFIVPFGVKQIDAAWGCGIACLALLARSMILGDMTYGIGYTARRLVMPLVLLGVGYLAHAAMHNELTALLRVLS